MARETMCGCASRGNPGAPPFASTPGNHHTAGLPALFPSRTAQESDSSSIQEHAHATDGYGGAYPGPKFLVGADPLYLNAAPCELKKLLLVQASHRHLAYNKRRGARDVQGRAPGAHGGGPRGRVMHQSPRATLFKSAHVHVAAGLY